MSEHEVEHYALWLALGLLVITQILACATIVMLLVKNKDGRKLEAGPFCAGCGQPLRDDPISALATDQVALVVYDCPHCQTKTYLPNG